MNWSTKLRPQILVAMFLIFALGAVGCIAGIIALSKDVLQSDA